MIESTNGESRGGKVREALKILPLLGLVMAVALAMYTPSGRHYALATLYHLGPSKARQWVIDQCSEGESFDVELLMLGAGDKEIDVRRKSILAMDRNGARSSLAIPLLIQLSEKHEDYRTRGSAVHALGHVTEQFESVGAAILLATKDENINVVIAAGMSADKLKSKLSNAVYKSIQDRIEVRVLIDSSGVKSLRIPAKSG
ncbi:MAG: hypothetical protein P1V97_00660 [Planctomycetota bacterium]|nr:hypothetical protein [Planctomycetota bacterium]